MKKIKIDLNGRGSFFNAFCEEVNGEIYIDNEAKYNITFILSIGVIYIFPKSKDCKEKLDKQLRLRIIYQIIARYFTFWNSLKTCTTRLNILDFIIVEDPYILLSEEFNIKKVRRLAKPIIVEVLETDFVSETYSKLEDVELNGIGNYIKSIDKLLINAKIAYDTLKIRKNDNLEIYLKGPILKNFELNDLVVIIKYLMMKLNYSESARNTLLIDKKKNKISISTIN